MGIMKNIYTAEKENIIKNEVNRFFTLLCARRPDVSFNVIRKRDGRYGVGDTRDDFPANNVLNASDLWACRPFKLWDKGAKKNRYYWLETYVFNVMDENKRRFADSLDEDFYAFDDLETLPQSIQSTLDKEWRFLDRCGDRIDDPANELIQPDDEEGYVFIAFEAFALEEELLSIVRFCEREEKIIVFDITTKENEMFKAFTISPNTSREDVKKIVAIAKPSENNEVYIETRDVYDVEG